MKHIIRLVVAIVLTMPVCFALSRIDPLARWVGSDSTWEKLRPLFRLAGTRGMEGEEDVVITLILVASFFIAWGIVCGASMAFEKWRNSRVK